MGRNREKKTDHSTATALSHHIFTRTLPSLYGRFPTHVYFLPACFQKIRSSLSLVKLWFLSQFGFWRQGEKEGGRYGKQRISSRRPFLFFSTTYTRDGLSLPCALLICGSQSEWTKRQSAFRETHTQIHATYLKEWVWVWGGTEAKRPTMGDPADLITRWRARSHFFSGGINTHVEFWEASFQKMRWSRSGSGDGLPRSALVCTHAHTHTHIHTYTHTRTPSAEYRILKKCAAEDV
jgi:hypothetical protein